jgi:hypothetical protein
MEDVLENQLRRKERLEMYRKKGKGRVSRGLSRRAAGPPWKTCSYSARGEGVIRGPWRN